MLVDDSDFIIKRKRNRAGPNAPLLASLNLPQSSRTAHIAVDLAPLTLQEQHLTYRQPSLPKKLLDVDLAPITVESFLRWSAQTPTETRKQRHRRKIKLMSDHIRRGCNLADDRRHSALSVAVRRPHQYARRFPTGDKVMNSLTAFHTTRPRTFKRKEGTLAGRLLTAAVLSHVEPIHHIVDPSVDAHTCTRIPLLFGRADHASSVPPTHCSPQLKPDDPRKSVRFCVQGSGFNISDEISHPSIPPRMQLEKPISSWMPNSLARNIEPSSKRRKLSLGLAKDVNESESNQVLRNVIPFTLVPLQLHEAQLHKRFISIDTVH
ncbi:uncharacterized protein FIBRA_06395 [Fibroporia radiculosa]|uniref:Uncharacterized protein n=1 Tax=Fibroporia radiculosa TaxID=599839 RepID=J4GBD0_9APHY|nr:uncharacterized protein FIBRA_06395 [Fibroporia radiculosa]CCM04228.1 predicted protein [Fibroporia radiculosa]